MKFPSNGCTTFSAPKVFTGVILAAAAALVWMQIRWTGELAVAERERLSISGAEQVRAVASAFDRELEEACTALRPAGGLADGQDLTETVKARWESWTAGPHLPMFRRVATVTPSLEGLVLHGIHGHPADAGWPVEWATLRVELERKLSGGSPPVADPTGLLLEFPVRRGSERVSGGSAQGGPSPERERRGPPMIGGPGGSPDGPPPDGPPQDGDGSPPRGRSGRGPGAYGAVGFRVEQGWLLLELDRTYVTEQWLPGLVRTYLNPAGRETFDVRVRSDGSPGITFYTSGTVAPGGLQVRFHRMGRGSQGLAERSRMDGLWLLEASPRAGEIGRMVARSRWRSLALGLVLTGLIAAAGFVLVRNTARARALTQAQMRFVAGVSHELRTPLTVIRGAAHNLERGIVTEPDRVVHYAGMVRLHTDQLTEMVEQIIDYGRAGVSLPAAQDTAADVGGLVQKAIEATRHETDSAGCRVQLHLSPQTPKIAGDPIALRRAVQNLIINAARHAGSGREIDIEVTSDVPDRSVIAKNILISVSDRGPGLEPGEIAMLFEPFFRGQRSERQEIRGSGIGLSLVREIALQHGGAVTAANRPGGGSVFTLRLPVHGPNQK